MVEVIKQDPDKFLEEIYLSENLLPLSYADQISKEGAWAGAIDLKILLNVMDHKIIFKPKKIGRCSFYIIEDILVPDQMFNDNPIRLLFTGNHYKALFKNYQAESSRTNDLNIEIFESLKALKKNKIYLRLKKTPLQFFLKVLFISLNNKK